MEAKKFIDSKKEGEYEIKRFHIKPINENIDLEWICDKLWLYDEDGYDGYFTYGLHFDWEGDIFCVDADKFIDGVKSLIHERLDDDDEYLEEDDVRKIFKNLEILEKYKGYIIHL